MANNFLVFQIAGDVALTRKFDYTISNLTNLRPFYEKTVELINKNLDKNFTREGAEASKWQSLSSRTLKARSLRQGYYSRSPSKPRILRWTGALQENKQIEATSDYARVTFMSTYAKFHQFGTKRVPARPFVKLDNSTNSLIIRNLENFILKDLRK